MTERVVVDFDHHSKEYREHGMEIAAEARKRCPVAWSEHYGGYWFVTGLDEASAFQKRPDLFSARREVGNPESVYKGIAIPFVESDYPGGFLEMDPPEQLEYRRILNPFLSPASVAKWEPLIREFTNACIDDFIEEGRGDFVQQVVNVVPAVLTMAMIGLPLGGLGRLQRAGPRVDLHTTGQPRPPARPAADDGDGHAPLPVHR